MGGVVYHVTNRGNARNDVFHKSEDFAAFLNLMRQASERLPMRMLAYCLMTNHFHLVLWPHEDGDSDRPQQIRERSLLDWISLHVNDGEEVFSQKKIGMDVREQLMPVGQGRQQAIGGDRRIAVCGDCLLHSMLPAQPRLRTRPVQALYQWT